MEKTGHWGVALLAFAPVGAVLLAAGHDAPALVGGAGVFTLTRLPDYDLRIPLLRHREITHTVAFAALVGLLLGGPLYALAGTVDSIAARPVGAFGFGVGAMAVLAHLLADALTPSGVAPFWPFWARRFSLGLVRSDSTLANWTLFVLGCVAVLWLVAFRSGLSLPAGP